MPSSPVDSSYRMSSASLSQDGDSFSEARRDCAVLASSGSMGRSTRGEAANKAMCGDRIPDEPFFGVKNEESCGIFFFVEKGLLVVLKTILFFPLGGDARDWGIFEGDPLGLEGDPAGEFFRNICDKFMGE